VVRRRLINNLKTGTLPDSVRETGCSRSTLSRKEGFLACLKREKGGGFGG